MPAGLNHPARPPSGLVKTLWGRAGTGNSTVGNRSGGPLRPLTRSKPLYAAGRPTFSGADLGHLPLQVPCWGVGELGGLEGGDAWKNVGRTRFCTSISNTPNIASCR